MSTNFGLHAHVSDDMRDTQEKTYLKFSTIRPANDFGLSQTAWHPPVCPVTSGCYVASTDQMQDALWSNSAVNLSILILYLVILVTGIIANVMVVVGMQISRIGACEMTTLIVISNIVMDCLLALFLTLSDVFIPFVSQLLHPYICRFRNYLVHVCATMNGITTSSLLLLYRNNYCTHLFSGGLFVLPPLLGFACLAGNIWTLMLYECQPVVFLLLLNHHQDNTSIVNNSSLDGVALAVSVTRLEAVFGRVLLANSALVLCVPLILCGVALIRAVGAVLRKEGTAPQRKRLQIGASLFLVNIVLLPTEFAVTAYGTFDNTLGDKMRASYLVATLASRLLFSVQFLVKPIIYACLFRHAASRSLDKRRSALAVDGEKLHALRNRYDSA